MTKDQLELDRQIRELKAAMEDDARKQKELEVRLVLSHYRFPTQQVRKDARELLLAKLEAHNGSDMDLYSFVDLEISRRPAWQTPSVMSEPLEPETQPAGVAVVPEFDIDRIGPNSSPAELEEARRAIIKALPQRAERRY